MESLTKALQFSMLFLPSIITLMIPFALLFAIVQTLSSLQQNYELIIIQSSGANRFFIAIPILLFASLLSIGSFILANYITPKARFTMRHIAAEAQANFINLSLKEGTFKKISDGLNLRIWKNNQQSGLNNFFLSDTRDTKKALYYYAREATLQKYQGKNYLILKNGQIAQEDRQTNKISLLQFNHYTLDLSDFLDFQKSALLYPKDRSLSYLAHPAENDPYYKLAPNKFLLEWHKRLVNWLYPLLFAFIATNFLTYAKTNRQKKASNTILAITLCLGLYWLMHFIAGQAETNLKLIPYLYFIPILVFFIFSIGLYKEENKISSFMKLFIKMVERKKQDKK